MTLPAFLLLSAVALPAQFDAVPTVEVDSTATQINSPMEIQSSAPDQKSLFEEISKIEKKTDKFNLFLNMHGDFVTNWQGSEFEGGKFQMKQLRIEMKGNINDWLSYRYRQRLNKGDNPSGYFDNVLQSIDIAGIGVKVKKFNFFLGKQCASYGGIEFDLNPIEIYQYSDMVDYMTNFMTGVNIAYNINPNQQLQFQVLDALVGSSQSMYGDWTPAKLPLVYTLNWNGSFGNVFNTRWSASVMNETKDKHMYYFALGNQFTPCEKFDGFFDWMYSIENVDRKGLMTSILGNPGGDRNVTNASYMSFVLKLNYHFHPNWNIFVKGMAENEGLTRDYSKNIEKGRYRTAWGYIGGVEYYPFKDRTLHFFVAYVGRSYCYTERAKALGNSNYNTNQLSVGFIWQMPIF